MNKVDLTLLKRLVAELENALSLAEAVPDDNKNDFIVELAKAAGLSSEISKEAKLLTGDIMAYSVGKDLLSVKEQDPGAANFIKSLETILKDKGSGSTGSNGSN